MESFWDWLIGEAGAGWIIGLLGVMGGVYAWLRRERPGRVIVQEVNRVRLLDIDASQRNQLAVYYKESDGTQVQITDLVQSEWVIYNGGSRDILEPFSITLGPKGKAYSGFLKVVGQDNWCRSSVIRDPGNQVVTGIRFEFDYLNAYQEHEQIARFFLLAEQVFSVELVEGNGRGWSAMLDKSGSSSGIAIAPVEAVLWLVMMISVVGMVMFFPQMVLSEEEFYNSLAQNWGFTVLVSAVVISFMGLALAMAHKFVIERQRRWRLGLRRIAAREGKHSPENRARYSLAWAIKNFWEQGGRDS